MARLRRIYCTLAAVELLLDLFGKLDSVSDLENLWLTNASLWPTTPVRRLSFAAFPRWNACSARCNVAELNAQRFFRAHPIQSQRNSHGLPGRGQSCT